MRIASLPTEKLAHQVIYIPPERTTYTKIRRSKETSNLPSAFISDENSKYVYAKRNELEGHTDTLGSVYCFGGKG